MPLLPEIWSHICSFMLKPSLSNLRLTSRQMNHTALPHLFRSLRLEGFGGSAERVINIAKSPKLRGLVRELTIDSWIGPGFEYNANEDYKIPTDFMDALPYIRCFGKVTTMNLRFNEFCGDDDRDYWRTEIEETWSFRYRIIDTVCHCIVGMWTKERQERIDNRAGLEYDPEYPEDDLGVPLEHIMPLKELTISNLADYPDTDITRSKAWKKLLSLDSLVNLKLFIATEVESSSPESAVFFAEKYEFFGDLPNSWLSSPITDNLRVLSLFYCDYWGWFPKFDFRLINEGGSPFPQLKVLALGNYVFSHDWQIDWFTTIGSKNGSGGLEELYLDDCPILTRAQQMGPLSRSDPGYPRAGTVMQDSGRPDKFEYSLRWHQVLSRWTESMKALKVFRMDRGAWNSPSPKDAKMFLEDVDDHGYRVDESTYHRTSYNIHRSFGGDGISVTEETRMQYIEYDIGTGPSPWLEARRKRWFPRDDDFVVTEELLSKDAGAYEALFAAINARQQDSREEL
ncbi:uncharacterized protein NECHADRAFT_39345 [Fusarium vanettenii 77-13-4]|uniref:F-box domain-containing protein n=1 Tax=Fusarium vanettenii (strain ATCC MYA-4622 / CBS 123669 / FGSC 9596 / NRRL 45880 / 77-13-4) TaxID=660122 RepID=C7Z874_FUSV7|nr:uncharacterized protein NECHADRAFT_39345 [Fusarium vanettenii 77-13-4]EEU39951.1 hypothetical protein NECHADRAFT_39345 [Fusarium vanettenii 77-13-4]